MTVTFVLNDNSKIVVPNSIVMFSSKYIKHLLLDAGITDVTIDIPYRYSFVFGIYLDFLYRKDHGINDVNVLLLCFDMESYFADEQFFEYLMSQAYVMWSTFYPTISSVPDERLVYLYTPYEFVPHKYMSNPSFFNEWLDINQNKKITIDGNEMYHTDVRYYNNKGVRSIHSMRVYCTMNGNRVGYGLRQEWYPNGQLRYRKTYLGEEENGLQQGWYANGQPEYRHEMSNGRKNGLREGWYADNKPSYRENYVNDYEYGLQEGWNRSGQISYYYFAGLSEDQLHSDPYKGIQPIYKDISLILED
jgi:hypothetical protein